MDFLKKLGFGKIASIASVGVIIISLIVYLTSEMSTASFTHLYTDLSSEDIGLIEGKLSALGIKYEIDQGGSSIKVPASKVLMLRMMFAEEGIPNSGSIVGYEIFDKSDGLATSQFVYNVNLVRALEGELARTISSINKIESTRVHLVLPKKELFSKSSADPSASVVLKIKGKLALSRTEVDGISNLVATAVPGLKVENITIVDTLGRALKLGGEDMSSSVMTNMVMDFQQTIQSKLKKDIEELVERSVGIGKVKASVAVEADFDKEIINSEVYDPNAQVVRSRKTSEQKEKDNQPSQGVSVANNLPNASGSGAGSSATKDRSKVDEVVNYEISKTVTNKVIENGKIKKLSVAVLVDGIYEKDSSGNIKYSDRPQKELDSLKALIVSGIGIDEKRGDKIEIINLKFSSEFVPDEHKQSFLDFLPSDINTIAQTVVIGIVMILVLLLIIRPVIMRVLEKARESSAMEENMMAAAQSQATTTPAQAASTSVDIANLITPEAMMTARQNINITPSVDDINRQNLLKHFNETVEKHPEETVSILRNWLYQE